MTVYHVETQQDYDALMVVLEEIGFKWRGHKKLTDFDEFKTYGKDTYIYEEHGVVSFSDGDYFNKHHKDEPIIEYKSKGDKQMLNLECKQCHKKGHQDSAKYCSWCGNKLVAEPKFKVGDYAVELGKYITKIEKIDEGMPKGCFYMPENNHFFPIKDSVSSYIARHATPEEIAEYEVALQFHKHGRKPFEVKEGDLIEYPCGQNIMIYHPDCFSKTDFLNDVFKLLKTAEEVSEWLENK